MRLTILITPVRVLLTLLTKSQEVATELVIYARLIISALNAAIDDGLTDLPIVLP